MVKLLLVGDGRSIFFVNYVKALKKKLDIEVTVYCPFPKNDWYDNYPYDFVYFDDYQNKRIANVKFFGFQSQQFVFRKNFGQFLKEKKIVYDIIHFHWLLPAWTMNPSIFKKYGRKIVVSFWGGELESQKLLCSHKLYIKKLGDLLKIADKGIGTTAINNPIVYKLYPYLKGKCSYGIYGSSIVDIIYRNGLTKDECLSSFGISPSKITVMLGYSGKVIHNHTQILDLIYNHSLYPLYKEKLHFLLPMTRGASQAYIEEIEQLLDSNDVTYTLIKNCYQSDEDVAKLRKVTDIIFQLSKHDEVSASIIENLCAGALMIAGDWFPNYSVLKNYGFDWIKVKNSNEAVNLLFDVLEHPDKYTSYSLNNRQIGVTKFTWDYCINDWVNIYDELISSMLHEI